MNACEYVFLHAGGCLLETPDLDELSGPRGAYTWRWVATHASVLWKLTVHASFSVLKQVPGLAAIS